jgi:hypothetical protein
MAAKPSPRRFLGLWDPGFGIVGQLHHDTDGQLHDPARRAGHLVRRRAPGGTARLVDAPLSAVGPTCQEGGQGMQRAAPDSRRANDHVFILGLLISGDTISLVCSAASLCHLDSTLLGPLLRQPSGPGSPGRQRAGASACPRSAASGQPRFIASVVAATRPHSPPGTVDRPSSL